MLITNMVSDNNVTLVLSEEINEKREFILPALPKLRWRGAAREPGDDQS